MQNDDYPNRGRSQTEDPQTYAWDPNRGAGPSSGVPVKMEFDPGPYNTDEQLLKWRRAAKSISSDDTGEEDMMTSRKRNTGIHEQAESVRLSKTQVQNERLLLQRDVKQEPDEHHVIKQEPDDHPQQQRDTRLPPPQRIDPLRIHNTITPTTQGPPLYYQRGPPRDNWEYRPGINGPR